MSETLIQVCDGKARIEDAEQEARFPWSASRLKKMLLCPRQFRFAYVDRLPTVTTAPLAFGRAVHEAVRYAHEEQMMGGTLPPIRSLLEWFDELWTVAQEEEVLFRPSHPTSYAYQTMGHEALRVFHALNGNAAPPLAVELPFEVEVRGRNAQGEEEMFLLRGIVDRVDEVVTARGESALVVVDYKSGSRKPKPEEAQGDVQLTLYSLALRQMLGIRVERVEFHLLRDGQVLASERHNAALDHLTHELLPYASETMVKGEFKPCPGYWCRWCDFQEPCYQEGFLLETSGGEADGLRR